jgi:hypothetical protein
MVFHPSYNLFLQHLESLSFKVSEIYNAVLWVQTRLSEPDTRHTWLQEPMRWEDAYGRVFPIPAEFDYLVRAKRFMMAPCD